VSYVFGDFRLDPRKRLLARRAGTVLSLTPKLFDALLFMLEHPGEDLDKDQLMSALWPGLVVEENNLSQAISGLRKVLGDGDGQHRYIVTVPRRGYRFVATVTKEEAREGAAAAEPALAPGTAPELVAAPAGPRPAGAWRFAVLPLLLAALALVMLVAPWKQPPAAPEAAPVERLGVEPAAAAGPAPPGAPALARSIAVLPFANMSGDRGQEYFSDGMSEELLNQLTKLRDLRVIARTSSFSFKGQNLDVSEIARRLHVDHVLQGSVRRSGNRVRITVQLVRAADSSQLWSGTYDRDLTDIFAVQDGIAAAVVTQLKAKLLGDLRQRKPVKPQAYALLLQAREAAHLRSAAGFTQAIALLGQALKLEPAYVEAWAELGAAYGAQAGNGLAPVIDGYTKAREATLKALAIDPDYAFVHAELAWIAMAFDHDLATAAQHLNRAAALAPDDDEVWRAAGPLAQALGRMDASIAIREARAARDPANVLTIADLAHGYLAAGRLDDGIARLRQVLAADPARPIQRATLAVALLKKGQSGEALAQLQALPQDSPARLVHSPIVWFALGDRVRSDAALAALVRQREQENPYHIAWTHAFRGEADAAFDWLRKAVAYRDPSLFKLATDAEFARLHADPRWLPLLRSLGMAPEQLAAIRFELNLP
jgi:TolB-like protein/DNA-binding winged helix-turn-helix (wHTH) protein/Tfp pilus assembly protein PilF